MMKLLFVCTGNTCRSPLAEFLMHHHASKRGLELQVRSAGISVFDDAPISQGSAGQLRAHHLPGAEAFICRHCATQLTRDDLVWADRVLTMTRAHRDLLHRRHPDLQSKITTLWDAAEGQTTHRDVSDPYGQDDEAYHQAFTEIDHLIESFLGAVDDL